MTLKRRRTAASVVLSIAFLMSIGFSSNAQISLDGTMGLSGNMAGPNYSITANLGRQLGGNLFHSFAQFNVRSGESATFSGPGSVANIISRVTGGTASSIDGLLRSTVANANLYLINPKGIAFGSNASIDIGGSFYASSADHLKFADGSRFDATNPGASTLSAAPPSAFGFLGPTPAAISVNGATLSAPDGRGLTLVAGELRVENAVLAAPGGVVNIASMAAAGDATLGMAGVDIGTAQGGAAALTSSQIDVSGVPGLPSGSIYIHAGKLTTIDSGLSAINMDSAAGGVIVVDVDGQVSMRGGSFSSIAMAAGAGNRMLVAATGVSMDSEAQMSSSSLGNGKAGDVSVAADAISIVGGAQISSFTAGAGQGADVRINATDIGMDFGTLSTDTGGTGRAGKLSIAAKHLRLANDSIITTITQGSGSGGDIELTADRVDIAGGQAFPDGILDRVTGLTYYGLYSGIYTTSQGANGGSAGKLKLKTGRLRISDGGTISGITLGSGDAGSFSIEAGDVRLEAGGLIHTSTSGSGAAGNITLNAAQSVYISGRLDTATYAGFAPRGSNASGIVSKATLDLNPRSESLGNGGSISVTTPVLTLTGNGEISTSAEKNAPGGTIRIAASSVEFSDGASVSSESRGSGNAGNITINAAERLHLLNRAGVTTQASSADGGDIEIKTGSLVHLSHSRITTSVGTGFGNGGNIGIDPEFVVLNQSSIIANAYGGNGGNIRIVAQNFVASPGSLVDASSQLGIDGNVEISSPQADVGAGLGVLPAGFFDASSLLRESCAARAGRAANSFVAVGRGGLPTGPEDLAYSDHALASSHLLKPVRDDRAPWADRGAGPTAFHLAARGTAAGRNFSLGCTR